MTEEKKPRKRGPKSLTPAEWVQIKVSWELGTATLESLSEKWSLSPSTLSKKLTEMGAVKGRRAKYLSNAIENSLVNKQSKFVEEMAEKVDNTKRTYFEWTNLLAKLAMAEIAEAKREKRKLDTVLNSLRALDTATSIIAKSRQECFSILGIDKGDLDKDSLPELLVSEMTAEEVEVIKERIMADDVVDDGSDIIDSKANAENSDVVEEGDDENVVVEGDDFIEDEEASEE